MPVIRLIALVFLASAATAAPLALGPSVRVERLEIPMGSALYQLGSGSAAPILQGEKPVGLFFKGTGRYAYTSSEAIEQTTVRYLADKATRLKAKADGGKTTIEDGLAEVAIWLEGAPLPTLEGGAGEDLAAAWTAHEARFARALVQPREHLFIVRESEAPSAIVGWAEIEGSSQPAIHVYDTVVGKSESLTALHEYSKKIWAGAAEFLYPIAVSDQPIGRRRQDPLPPRIRLVEVDLRLKASADREASLEVTETLVPLVPQQVILLNLTSFTLPDAERPIRQFHLRKVKDAAGNELQFGHRGDRVAVILPARAPAGKPLKLAFEIDGDFLVRPSNSSFWQLSVEPWFPLPELGARKFKARMSVSVPKPFVPFAPGVTVKRGEEGELNVLETRIDVPVDWLVVHAGKYAHKEETRDGLTVRVATYAGRNEHAMKQLTELTFAAVEFYQKFLGPFPFKEFNIIQIDTWGYGQAPPGTMFITHEAFSPLGDDISRIFSDGVNERFLHEIAHQYWGHLVMFPSDEEAWLSESFSSYTAALFLRQYKGESTYKRIVSSWKGLAGRAGSSVPIALANRPFFPDDRGTTFGVRTGLLYGKGPYLLSKIHAEIGDEAFLTFLKSYQKNFAGKSGSTAHVAGLLGAITKKDWTPFLDKYFWGTETP